MLGVSPDSVESHDKFKAKLRLNFPLVSDPDHKIAEAYGVWKEKSLYGRKYIDRKSTRLNSSHIQKSRMPSSA